MLTIAGKSIKYWTANQNSICANGKGLEDILAIADASIEENGDVLASRVLDSLDYFGQHLDRGRRSVELPGSMIGHVDSVSAILDGKLCIVIAHDTFRDNFESRVLFDVRDNVPTDFVVLVVFHVLGKT